MITPEYIAQSRAEFRELLHLSCMQLAAADQQFSIPEQQWFDKYFGPGAGDGFIEQLPTIDWGQVNIRLQTLYANLTATEKEVLHANGRTWFTELLSVDGLEQEEIAQLESLMALFPQAETEESNQPFSRWDPEPAPSPVQKLHSERDRRRIKEQQKQPVPQADPEPAPSPDQEHHSEEEEKEPMGFVNDVISDLRQGILPPPGGSAVNIVAGCIRGVLLLAIILGLKGLFFSSTKNTVAQNEEEFDISNIKIPEFKMPDNNPLGMPNNNPLVIPGTQKPKAEVPKTQPKRPAANKSSTLRYPVSEEEFKRVVRGRRDFGLSPSDLLKVAGRPDGRSAGDEGEFKYEVWEYKNKVKDPVTGKLHFRAEVWIGNFRTIDGWQMRVRKIHFVQ